MVRREHDEPLRGFRLGEDLVRIVEQWDLFSAHPTHWQRIQAALMPHFIASNKAGVDKTIADTCERIIARHKACEATLQHEIESTARVLGRIAKALGHDPSDTETLAERVERLVGEQCASRAMRPRQLSLFEEAELGL